MKKTSTLLLIATLIFGSISYGEGFKEESIYGLISEKGTLDALQVVNAIHGLTYDYGNYDVINNLTTLEELTNDDSKIAIPVNEDIFYYQGIMNTPKLPWDFEFTYSLDGAPTSLKALAGASGNLKIIIDIKPGSDQFKDFYESYALQVGLKFSNDLVKEIEAKGATIVEAGGNKQVAFTVLPGQGANLKVEAVVEDFEMDPITINGVKMVFDMTIDPSELTNELEALKDGISDLDDGAKGLLDGISKLSTGLTEYTSGMNRFKSGIYQLKNSGRELSIGFTEMVQGLNSLKEQGQILNQGVQAMESNAFAQINGELKSMGLTLPELNRENYKAILGQNESLKPIEIQLEQTLALTQGLGQYIMGVGQLASGAGEISTGLDSYVEGIAVLAESSYVLYESASELNQAMVDIKSGMTEYRKGTETFKTETANMDVTLEAKVDDLLSSFMGDASETRSFSSVKNEDVASVQFFFRTQAIAKEKMPIVVEEVVKTTFWQRIKNLFNW